MRPKSTWLALAWTLIVFVACWAPKTMLPVSEHHRRPFPLSQLDKAVHFTFFFGFGLSWCAAAPGRSGRVAAAGIVAAALTELGQATPLVARDCEWGDGVADVLGLVAGMAAYFRVRAALIRRALVATTPSAGTP